MIGSLLISLALAQTPPPTITVDRDNIEITKSCTIKIARDPIEDADNNGVIHITADNITVDLAGATLHGAKPGQLPDSFSGIGILISGKNVTLTNAKISCFKVGILAQKADALTISNTDVSGNFQQRLKSTPKAEDGSDWLWPHENDKQEWRDNYGAGICVEDCSKVTLRDIAAHHGQNGIILDRVNDSSVYGCDCSFLSGWGLAMWRSSRNGITRNAFDFCVRGYSHGVYNRGQDSAGILMFEQCCENFFVQNSVTHGGDGFFGFAGKEALGQSNPRNDSNWYRRRGCNDNKFMNNDFSCAVAHGLELTFSFGNHIWYNRFDSNAICGIWGGYSQSTIIAENQFNSNGDMAYGLERGGINIEHGHENMMFNNTFTSNKCGVYLWGDDGSFAQQPWGKANGVESSDNVVVLNKFDGNHIDIQLRQTTGTQLSMQPNASPPQLDADEMSRKRSMFTPGWTGPSPAQAPDIEGDRRTPGSSDPRGRRSALAGREHIIITEWGPYDWESPYLQRIDGSGDAANKHAYRLLGKDVRVDERAIHIEGEADAAVDGDRIIVVPHQGGSITPYSISLNVNGANLTHRDVLVDGTWDIDVFAYTTDPRKDVDAWHKEAAAGAVHFTAPALDLRYGMNGPSQLNLSDKVTAADLPRDHFGTIATTQLAFPSGKWRLKTNSDDGIRVWLDGALVIDDWTHHGPTPHDYDFALDKPKTIDVRAEHFELDGFAALTLDVEQGN